MAGIMIGIGPKSGGRGMPPPPDDDDMPGQKPDAEPDNDEGEGGKATPERALVSHADENCGNCVNYHGEDGSCEEVSGQYDPMDRCYAYFKSGGGGQQSEDGSMPPPPDDNAGENGQ